MFPSWRQAHSRELPKSTSMVSAWLNRSVVALFLCTLALMTVTAFSSSSSHGLDVPAWAQFSQFAHRRLAEFVSLLALVTLFFAYRQKGNPLHRMLSTAIAVGVFALAGLGIAASRLGSTPPLGMLQSSLLHFVFAAMVVLLLSARVSMLDTPTLVEDEFRPSLRTMAWVPAILIAAQIILGSAYRHGLTGVIPHLIGAFAVAGLLALVGLLVATTYPKHRPLRQSALALVWMMLAQVVLGVVALSYRANSGGTDGVWDPNFVMFTVGHILLGSFTLASCVWLAMTIREHVVGAAAAPVASFKRETA